MKTDNELIAEFMGFGLLDETPVSKTKIFKLTDKNGDPIHPYYGPMRGEQMRFGSSWDWLMPVVEAIEEIEEPHPSNNPERGTIWPYQVEILSRATVQIIDNQTNESIVTVSRDGIAKIEAVYKAVVEFIKWYNEQPK